MSATLAEIHAELREHVIAPALVAADEGGRPRLKAGRCGNCRELSFPRAAVCASCMSEEIGPELLGSEGELYSFSVVHQAPRPWRVPYAIGYVDLPEGVRLLAHLAGPFEWLRCGAPVRLEFAEVGTAEDGSPLVTYAFAERAGHA